MNYKISYLLDEYAGQKIALSLAQQITDLSQRELVTQLSTIGGSSTEYRQHSKPFRK